MRRASRALAVAPLVLAPLAFVAVLALGPRAAPFPRRALPDEPRAASCTWYCHNHTCPHRAALPASLASDAGLYGETIRALFSLGRCFTRDRATGYGAANVVVFLIAWPSATYALWIVALRQRARRTR